MFIDTSTHPSLLLACMGSEATEIEARWMKNILIQSGYGNTDTTNIPDADWLEMLETAVRFAAENPTYFDADSSAKKNLKPQVSMGRDSNNQHIVAIEYNGEIRCYFKHHSWQVALSACNSLNRDIQRNTDTWFMNIFQELPAITVRASKGEKIKIYDTAS